MRDPVFYRWHAFIDDVFQEHKQSLPEYSGPQVRNMIFSTKLLKNYKNKQYLGVEAPVVVTNSYTSIQIMMLTIHFSTPFIDICAK